MTTIAPIDYGNPVRADTEGVSALQQAVALSGSQRTQATEALGNAVEHTGGVIAQGLLQNQVSKAIVQVSRAAADTKRVFENNNELDKGLVKEALGDQYESWHANLAENHPDLAKSDTVPTWAAAGPMFKAVMKTVREKAMEGISLPGWRQSFERAAIHQEVQHQEWVDRVAGYQMKQDMQQQSVLHHQQLLDLADSPAQIEDAIKKMKADVWLAPGQKVQLELEGMKLRDTFTADRAMSLAGSESPALRQMALGMLRLEQEQLLGVDRAKAYPNLSEQERTRLSGQVASHIHALKAYEDHQAVMDEKARKAADDRQLGLLIQSIGRDQAPLASGVLKVRNWTPGMNLSNPQLGDGFFESEKMHLAMTLLDKFYKDAKEPKQQSDRQKYEAISNLFVHDPTSFQDAMLSGQKFSVTSFGRQLQVDPEHDLNWEDHRHFINMAIEYQNKAKDERDAAHAAEASVQLAADATMWKIDPDNENHLWDADPLAAGRRALVREAMENAVRTTQQARPGKPLTPDERDAVMLRSGDDFVRTAKKVGWIFKSPQIGSREIRLLDGSKRVITEPEVTDMRTAAQSLGIHPLAVDTHDFMQEFFSRWNQPINLVLQRMGYDSDFLTREEKFRVAIDAGIKVSSPDKSRPTGITKEGKYHTYFGFGPDDYRYKLPTGDVYEVMMATRRLLDAKVARAKKQEPETSYAR